MKKMQHCFYCGEELGVYEPFGNYLDTCGSPECEREARAAEAAEREEAHHDLDQQMGWD